MPPINVKHQKQKQSYVSNLITLPIISSNGVALQNETIGLIICQSTCNKSDEISDVVKDVNLDALVIIYI